MNYNYNYLFLDLIITILLFLIIPFITFYKREKYYTKKQRTIILVLNSVFIEIIYIIIQCCLIGDYTIINFAPAVIYYYINKLIWKKNRFSDKVKKSESKNIFNKIKLKSILLFIIFICLIIYIIILNMNISQLNKRAKQLKDNYNELSEEKEYYENILEKMNNKLTFYDEHIVFEVNDIPGKYMSYNCMKYIMQDRSYSYRAYNVEQAKGKGLTQYKCSALVELID